MPSAGGEIEVRGLSFSGIITRIISTTQFESAQLAGKGDNFFQPWDIYVVRKSTGTGAAPQSEKVNCSAYLSLSGRFTHTAFGVSLAIGDEVYAMHPYIGSNTVTTVYPSNNLKEWSDTEVQTSSVAYVKVKELSFTGVQGGARIFFDLKVDSVLGTAFAVIYKNGVPVPTIVAPFYTIYTNVTGIYATFSQDVYGLRANDLIQIYARVNAVTRTAFVRNFRIGYDIITFPSVALAMDMVYIDTVNGAAGSVWPMGTPGYPVNNLADAVIICGWRNTRNFHVKNSLVLDRPMLGYNFVGDMDWYISSIDLNNQDVDGSTFKGLMVNGSSPGYMVADDCFITGSPLDFSPAMIVGDLNRCRIGSIAGVPLSFYLNCTDCTAVGFPYCLYFTGGGQIGWAGGSGDVELEEMDDALSFCSIDGTNVALYIAATCTLGQLNILAAAYVHDQSAGVTIIDYWTYDKGKTNTFYKRITSAANAGMVLCATPHIGKVKVKHVVLRSNGNTTVDLTSAGVYAGVGNVLVLIDPLLAIRANLLTYDCQQQGVGPWNLGSAASTISVNLVGTGPTAVDLTLEIEFESLIASAHLG